MEARRAEADRFAWAVPAVLIASQAFLLTIALDGDASPERRLIASLAAAVTLVGAFHQFWKQAFHFALYEAVIKRERRHAQLALVDRNSLLAAADTLEPRFHDEWLKKDDDGKLVWGKDGYYEPQWLIRRRATRVWLGIFILVFVLDVGLIGWALYDLDPFDWFDSDEPRRRWRL
jgi:hypothetical protein